MSQTVLFEYLLLAALWGSSFLFMRIGGAEFGVLPTAGVRVAIGALVLLPLLWFSGHAEALRKRAAPILYVGMLNSGLPFAFFAYAVTSISTGLSGILNATVPLFGAIIAWAWLGDRLNGSRVAGLVVGFTGIVLLAWDKASFHTGGSGWAVLACLAATVCYGYSANFTKKYLTGVHSLATAAGSQLGATLGLAIPTLWMWPERMPGARSWAALVVLGTLCTGLAYVLYFRLIERLGPARAVTVTFLVPVFAVLYGAIFLGEAITPWMLLCGAVIVTGTALSTGAVRLPRLQ